MRNPAFLAAAAVLVLGGAALAPVAQAGVMPEVRFPRGATGVTLEGSVASPDRNIYRLSARRGQTLRLRVRSPENNTVFQIYAPGVRTTQQDGYWEFSGNALPGAQDGDDATEFTGRLPAAGTYTIVVGPTRGAADYSLAISVR